MDKLSPDEMDIKNVEEWVGKWIVAVSSLDKLAGTNDYPALQDTFQNLANLAGWVVKNDLKD